MSTPNFIGMHTSSFKSQVLLLIVIIIYSRASSDRTLVGLTKTVELSGLNYVQRSVKGQQKGFDTSMVFELLQFKPSVWFRVCQDIEVITREKNANYQILFNNY